MNNTETAAPAATTTPRQRIAKIANALLEAVGNAPMSFVADGGGRALRLAQRLDDQAQTESRQRATRILEDLHDVLRTGHQQAEREAIHARMIGDSHAGDYNEGRAKGYAEARAAANEARIALLGIRPGNTRQDNAQAFAETIIHAAHTIGDPQ